MVPDANHHPQRAILMVAFADFVLSALLVTRMVAVPDVCGAW